MCAVPHGHEASLEAHERLLTLYEISKRLTHINSVEETTRGILDLMAGALGLRSALVVLGGQGQSYVIEPAAGASGLAEAHALASYGYLTGLTLVSSNLATTSHFIVLPMVVDARPVFGILQVEAIAQPSEPDLMFVNAVANQLAIALDAHATVEARQAAAEVATSKAEVGQAAAEGLQERYQALAWNNARLLHIAEQASQARDNMMAVVSHDMRNQINAILMSVSLLLKNRSGDPQDRRAGRNLVTIQRSALGMDHLIGDLLDIGSIESGHLTLHLQAEGAGELVPSALQLLEEQAAAQSVRLTSAVEGAACRVLCDRQRIFQVFSNVVGNALKFTRSGGTIDVRAEPRAGAMRFAVTDTGVGIPSDELPHVFDRYWQGNRTRAGAGLGMAIAKGIVAAHGGSIWLESEVGVGTTVYFTLPLIPAARNAAPGA